MLDLRDDGTIGIDFEDGQPTVVLARPKFGSYKRLRADAQKRVDALNAYLLALRTQDPPTDVATVNEQYAQRSEEDTVAWWQLVLNGDESFKSLVESGTVPPVDDWPSYLIYGTNVLGEVLAHWRHVPLGRSGQLEAAKPAE